MQAKIGQKIGKTKRKESAEIKFLRSVAGCTLLDQKRSTDIRSELKIFNLTEKIEKQKEN
jgi:hypothetical protein